jgi:hypothetical protein
MWLRPLSSHSFRPRYADGRGNRSAMSLPHLQIFSAGYTTECVIILCQLLFWSRLTANSDRFDDELPNEIKVFCPRDPLYAVTVQNMFKKIKKTIDW